MQVVPADGSAEPRPVSFLPNTFGGNVLWAPDGKAIYYSTNQRYEDTRVVRIDLQPRTPTFREDALRNLFEVDQEPSGSGTAVAADTADADDEEDAAPIEIEFEGIRSRYELLSIPFSVNQMAISPDGKVLILSGTAAGEQNLYALNLDPLSNGPGGGASHHQWARIKRGYRVRQGAESGVVHPGRPSAFGRYGWKRRSDREPDG